MSVLLSTALVAALVALVDPESALGDPTVAAAGDIACPASDAITAVTCRQAQTASLLAGADRVVTLGDNQYPKGTLTDFRTAYDATWGQYKAVTSPSPGNHEYYTPGATGYFDYFGVRPYYSFDVGAWHLVSLNTSIPVGEGTPQNTWLENDLAAHGNSCTLAYFHHPRYSAGTYSPGLTLVQPLWKDLLAARADVVLSGHDHNYQRWAPMDNRGNVKPTGIRQFIVGTGGREHAALRSSPTGLQAASDTTFGVLDLTLHADSYAWVYNTAGGTLDSGSAACH